MTTYTTVPAAPNTWVIAPEDNTLTDFYVEAVVAFHIKDADSYGDGSPDVYAIVYSGQRYDMEGDFTDVVVGPKSDADDIAEGKRRNAEVRARATKAHAAPV